MSETQLSYVLLLLVLANLVFAGYSYYALNKLKKLRQNFQAGGQAENLEEILSAIAANIKKHDRLHKDTETTIQKIIHQLGQTVQKIGVHKFNALADEGGNLSFSIAILNEYDSGTIITSLHNRNQTRIYSKYIREGASTIPLTVEEQSAIATAHIEWQKNISKKIKTEQTI